MKRIRYFIEAALFYFLYYGFKIMPLDMASALGGFIARSIGPHLGASRKARRNLENALPGKTKNEYDLYIREMWDNLGRVMAEYPHLEYIAKHRTTYENASVLEDALKGNAPVILTGAHIANWELGAAIMLTRFQAKLDITYRAPNNPYVDRLLQRARSLGKDVTGYPKARESGRKLLSAMKKGHNIGILIDQKYNEGIPVPFFGREAMTNPAFVQLAQKFGAPLIPVFAARMKGSHFTVTFGPPLNTLSAAGDPLPLEKVITQAHIGLEAQIRKYPGQWLWLHRRWKD